MILRAMVVGAVLGASPALAAQCQLGDKPWLEGRAPGQPAARAIDARMGEEIEVFLALPGTLDGQPVIFSEQGRPGRVSWQRSGCGPLSVTWHRVEPLMQHVHTPAPNGDMKLYSNAVVFGPRHGTWIGFDRLEYVQTPLPGAAGPVLRVRDARPSDAAGVPARDAAHAGLGVMRLSAVAQAGGSTRATPGAEDAPQGQISDRVFRYTYRSGDDFLGWLGTFFNLPYLFGSAGQGPRSQPERYIGADCADVLVAALHRAGLYRRLQYTNVAGLVDALKRTGGPAVVRPCPPDRPCPAAEAPLLHMGQEVRPGDLLAIDYIGVTDLPRGWDHIGVLVEDRGPGGAPDGVLGPEDLLAETGDALGLKIAPLGDQGEIRVVVLRP